MTKIEAKYREKCRTPSDIHEHLPTLAKYASMCNHVTELGVRTIVSTWAFLAGLDGSDEPVMISVDIAAPEKHGGNLGEVLEAVAETDIAFRFIEADDLKLDLEPTDLLFIDTWHVYEQLKAELARHAGSARKYIILHDTETFWIKGETEGHQGLLPALDEFLAEHPEWVKHEHFKNCNGLTVLKRTSPD